MKVKPVSEGLTILISHPLRERSEQQTAMFSFVIETTHSSLQMLCSSLTSTQFAPVQYQPNVLYRTKVQSIKIKVSSH